MKGILHEELSRAFRNRRLWIIILLTVASMAIGIYRRGLIFNDQRIHPVNLLMNISFYTPFSLIAALLATLPFADSFFDDRNQGFIRFIALRVSYRKYLAAKAIAVGLAGGWAISFSIILMLVLVIVTGPIDFSAQGYISNSTLVSGEPWGPLGWLYTVNPFSYFAYLLATAFSFGFVYALFGLAVSMIINNRYVVLAAPLVFFQLLTYLEARSLHILPAWNPAYTLFPFDAFEGFTLTHQLIQYGLLMAVACTILALFARKSRILQ
jgi:hypothetical protein